MVSLLKTLGFGLADKLDNRRLAGKLSVLIEIPESDRKEKVHKTLYKELLHSIISACEAGKTFAITGEDEMSVPKEKIRKKVKEEVPEKKVNKIKKVKEDPDENKERKPRAKKVGGVIATIVDCLKGASKKNPVSKEDIHKTLCKKFPDRSEESMLSTIRTQVPGKLKSDRELVVSTNGEGGYWLPKA